MKIDGAAIGRKYGKAVNDFEAANMNTLEGIVTAWCNEGADIMRKVIQRKSRTKGGSTLAQGIIPLPATVKPNEIEVKTISEEPYWDYVNKGVQGVKKNRAPQSPYKFKNLGTPPKMIDSFKQYIAATGLQKFGKKRIVVKDKKKQGDLVDSAAKQMAVATKIGGIRPMKFTKAALNAKRRRELVTAISAGTSEVIRLTISNEFK